MRKLMLLIITISFWSNCFATQQIPTDVQGFLHIKKEDIYTEQDLANVKTTYKQLALKFHPDKNPKGEIFFKLIVAKWGALDDEFKNRPKTISPQSTASGYGTTESSDYNSNRTTPPSRDTGSSPDSDEFSQTSFRTSPTDEPTEEERRLYYHDFIIARADATIRGKSFFTFKEYVEILRKKEKELERTARNRALEQQYYQEHLREQAEKEARERRYREIERQYPLPQKAKPITTDSMRSKQQQEPEQRYYSSSGFALDEIAARQASLLAEQKRVREQLKRFDTQRRAY